MTPVAEVPSPRRVHPVARFIVSERRWIALAWFVVSVFLLRRAPDATTKLAIGGASVDESQAAWVDNAFATRFASPFAAFAVLVMTGVPSVADSAGVALLQEISDSLLQLPNVVRLRSYLNAHERAFVNDRGTYLLVALRPDTSHENRGEPSILALRAATERMQQDIRKRYPNASFLWTGSAAIDYDVRLTSSDDASAAERRVLPLTLMLLVAVFGSVVAAFLPIAVGALATGLSLGAAVLISQHYPLVILLQNVVTMLGLGVGVDYALLTVSRFREGLADGCTAEEAAMQAAHHAGHTVVLSGTAVAIGFVSLLLVPATELRSIAVGGALVVLLSVLVATTLLPGLLAWIGARIDMGLVRRSRGAVNGMARWRRWGRWVALHPMLVLVVGAAPLVALAWQARRLSSDIPSANWLPPRMESTIGASALQQMGQSGVVQTVRVLVELPAAHRATSEEGWQAIRTLSRTFERDARIASVRSLPLLLAAEHPSPTLFAFLPALARGTYLSRDERLALIDLVPKEAETPGRLTRYVRELRSMDIGSLTGLAGTRIFVGGLPAQNADYQDAIGGSVTGVIGLVVIGTFFALMIGFRSPLIAIKAVALNCLSVAAAVGASVLVFQDGHGVRLLGLAAPIDGLFPAVSIIVFCIVFGLSMDYEVFLVSRVAEGVREGLSDREALVEGLARTGGIITSAALVMLIVFAGFALGDFLIIKILGFTLAVAVLLDATLVRMAVGPALLRIAGRWNWWPGVR